MFCQFFVYGVYEFARMVQISVKHDIFRTEFQFGFVRCLPEVNSLKAVFYTIFYYFKEYSMIRIENVVVFIVHTDEFKNKFRAVFEHLPETDDLL